MKTTRKILMTGAAAATLLLAGCADGPSYTGPYNTPYPYSAYYGPYYNGGVVVLNRNFHHGYYGGGYGRGFARAGGYHGGYHGGGWHRH